MNAWLCSLSLTHSSTVVAAAHFFSLFFVCLFVVLHSCFCETSEKEKWKSERVKECTRESECCCVCCLILELLFILSLSLSLFFCWAKNWEGAHTLPLSRLFVVGHFAMIANKNNVSAKREKRATLSRLFVCCLVVVVVEESHLFCLSLSLSFCLFVDSVAPSTLFFSFRFFFVCCCCCWQKDRGKWSEWSKWSEWTEKRKREWKRRRLAGERKRKSWKRRSCAINVVFSRPSPLHSRTLTVTLTLTRCATTAVLTLRKSCAEALFHFLFVVFSVLNFFSFFALFSLSLLSCCSQVNKKKKSERWRWLRERRRRKKE